MSLLGRTYQGVYNFLCGEHPNYYPWHFQWIFLSKALLWQKRHMHDFHGRVLDVGCGDKPYQSWISPEKVDEYVGLDIVDRADIVVKPGVAWPLQDASFDCVLFTQVLEHLEDREHVLGEMNRVLKPGGIILITVPFMFPAHGLPHDYARFTIQGLEAIFAKQYDIVERMAAGGAGTVMASSLLTWLEAISNTNLAFRLLKGVLLPLWLLVAALINTVGLIIDVLDVSETHYANACMLVRKGKT